MIDTLNAIALTLAGGGVCGIAILYGLIAFSNVILLVLVAVLTGDRMSNSFFNSWMVLVPVIETVFVLLHAGVL